MTTIPIPPEAIEAAAKAIFEVIHHPDDAPWAVQPEKTRESCREDAIAALAAALSVGETEIQYRHESGTRHCGSAEFLPDVAAEYSAWRRVVTWPDGTVITTPWRSDGE